MSSFGYMAQRTPIKVTMKTTHLVPVRRYLQKMTPDAFGDILFVMLEDIWTGVHFHILDKIETGEGEIENFGKYAADKLNGVIYKQSYGHYIEVPPTNHPLGILTGELFDGVAQTSMGKVTREVSGSKVFAESASYFTKPDYLYYVHEGKARTFARPFISNATQELRGRISDAINAEMRKINIFQPDLFDLQWKFTEAIPGAGEKQLSTSI